MQKKNEARSVATASRLSVISQLCSLVGGDFGAKSGGLSGCAAFNSKKPPVQLYFIWIIKQHRAVL